MINNITSLEDIANELDYIQQYTDKPLNEEIRSVVTRGNYLIILLSRTSKLLADAKYHKDEKLNSVFMDEIKQINAFKAITITKLYIDSLCKTENVLINWCERLNRVVTHQIDWCRTMVSMAKSEMQNNIR